MAIQYYESIAIPLQIVQNLNRDHILVILADKIDWERCYDRFRKYYKRLGRMSKQIRLYVGLHILKHLYGLSDEEVVLRLHQDVYFMHFCGFRLLDAAQYPEQISKEIYNRYKQGKKYFLIHPSTMTKFRRKVGAEGMEMLKEIIDELLREDGQLKSNTALTDTTAMEKDISYPTDTKLLYHGLEKLVGLIRGIRDAGVPIKMIRSFKRKAKQALLYACKLGKDKLERVQEANAQLTEMLKITLKFVPCVFNETALYLSRNQETLGQKEQNFLNRSIDKLKALLPLIEKVMEQNFKRFEEGCHIPDKIYSLEEPAVVAIKKGKAQRSHEYGSKVSITITSGGYITGEKVYHENIADIETLPYVRESFEKATGHQLKALGGDRGYHHKKKDQKRLKTDDIEHLAIPTKGKKKHPDAQKGWFRRVQKLRAGIEAVIGHLKSDHLMDVCRYKGKEGDRINVALATTAWNLKKWAKVLLKRQNAP